MPTTPVFPSVGAPGPQYAEDIKAIVERMRGRVCDPRDYGAAGTGLVDDSDAIGEAFAEADAKDRPVFLVGTFLTDPIVWKGQRILGASRTLSSLKGKPGEDVLITDTSLGQFAMQGTELQNLTIVVDDSLDVSGSLDRDGAGNAGIAVPFPDGAAAIPPYIIDASIRDVAFVASSGDPVGGQNASCGVYEQLAGAQNLWERIAFRGLKFGWWQHYPTANVESVELGPDHTHLDTIKFYVCGTAMRLVDPNWWRLDNVFFHTCTTAFVTRNVQSLARSYTGNIDVGVMMIETAAVPLDIEGHGFTFSNLWIANADPADPITIGADEVHIDQLASASEGANPSLVLDGDHITIDRFTTMDNAATRPFGRNLVQDNGEGNSVAVDWFFGSGRGNTPAVISPDSRRLHERDTVAMRGGHVDPMFTSGNDLLLSPRWIKPQGETEGVGYSYITDSAAPLGTALRVVAAGGFFATDPDVMVPKSFYVGDYLPPTRLRVYICAKLATAGTQQWQLHAGATLVGSATLNFNEGYTVQSFDADLTGEATGTALQISGFPPGGGGALPCDVGFIGFRPYQADLIVAGAGFVVGELHLGGDLKHTGSEAGFMGAAPIARPTVSGSRGGNAALASLITALQDLGLVIDNTSA